MSDYYVAVHLASSGKKLTDITWCIVDARTLKNLPPNSLPLSSLKDAVARFDVALMQEVGNKDFLFVTADLHLLRVFLPNLARESQVVLPVYLQHPRVFDLASEYLKWQLTHPEALSYPASSLSNILIALGAPAMPEPSADSTEFAQAYANLLVCLIKKSVPVELHPAVLTKPYDAAQDAKVFLAERSKILYLANLPLDTTQLELESWFTQYGARPVAFWTLKNAQGNSDSLARGILGFAVFSKHEDAAESLYMNGLQFNDRVIEIQASSTRVLDRASDLLTPFPPLKNKPRPGDWTCPSCGFSNFQRRIACFRCLFPATSAVAIQELYTGNNNSSNATSAASNINGANTGNRAGNGSNSNSVNLPNDRKNDKFVGSYGYQDHYKSNYNHSNINGSVPRAHYNNSVPFRAGDWKCTNESCQYHNFAKNLCCLKCGSSKPANVHSIHGGSSIQHSQAQLAGSIHSVNSTAAAIAAATASGQPLSYKNNTASVQQQNLSRQGYLSHSQGSSSSPITANGLYSNISHLQQYQYQQGHTGNASSAPASTSSLPMHLAVLQGNGRKQQPQQHAKQAAATSPYLSYTYRNGGERGSNNGINFLSNSMNSLSLNNGQ